MPALHPDEAPLVEALAHLGVNVAPLVWGDAALAAEVDGFVVRNPWDWYLRPAEFDTFLAALPPARTLNPPALMRAYLAKDYLATLPSAVPTELVVGATAEVMAARARRGWEQAVVKPALSATAHRTVRLSDRGVAPELAHDRWLVQPFIAAVADGELSFVFLDGAFSHAVRKRPAPGDFRVQAEHGGSVERETPPPALVELAAAVLDGINGPPHAYARVDAVLVNGRLAVMELELVEPQLFFALCPEAGARLARAIVRRLA